MRYDFCDENGNINEKKVEFFLEKLKFFDRYNPKNHLPFYKQCKEKALICAIYYVYSNNGIMPQARTLKTLRHKCLQLDTDLFGKCLYQLSSKYPSNKDKQEMKFYYDNYTIAGMSIREELNIPDDLAVFIQSCISEGYI